MKKPTAKRAAKSGSRAPKGAKLHKPHKRAKAARPVKTAKPARAAKKAHTKKRATPAHHKLSRFGRRATATWFETEAAFVDLSFDPAMPLVSDQGDDGSCVAHASLALFTWATAKGLDLQIVGAPDVQACLSDGRPVAVGLLVFEPFVSHDVMRSGVVPDPGRRARFVGGHYLLIVGIGYGSEWIEYGEFASADPSVRYVKVRNSWGTDVYQQGHLLISVDYLTRYSTERWTVMQADRRVIV